MHPLLVHNQDVLRLDVSMNDIPLLHVEKSRDDLSDYVAGLILRKASFLFQSLVQVSVLRILKNDVDILLIVEVTKEADDMWMAQTPLDLELFLHLGEKVELFQQVLLHELESHLLI